MIMLIMVMVQGAGSRQVYCLKDLLLNRTKGWFSLATES